MKQSFGARKVNLRYAAAHNTGCELADDFINNITDYVLNNDHALWHAVVKFIDIEEMDPDDYASLKGLLATIQKHMESKR